MKVSRASQKRKYNFNRKCIRVCRNYNPVTLQLDTGSDITIISEKPWIKTGAPKLIKTFPRSEYCLGVGEKLKIISELNCEVVFRNKS